MMIGVARMDIDNIEQKMILFYNSLAIKDRYRYAAVEAYHRGGDDGIKYISALFGCDETLIRKGLSEFSDALSNREVQQETKK